MKYKYIFGPINSRRFGLSLGIDLSPDEKSCNFDCLYCELSVAALKDKIKNPPIVEDILGEVSVALREYPNLDVITITANGEPTLYSDLDKLVDGLNSIKGDVKLLILSNASNIYKREIQDVLKKIEIVKLSLDCATQECFRKIDRSLKEITIDMIIDGLKSFREIYSGELVIEILVVKGVNDSIDDMKRLNEVLNKIKPDRIDLGTIDRPPAYIVEGVSEDRLNELSSYFSTLPIHLVYKNRPKEKIDYSKDQIRSMIKMRPLSFMDVNQLFSDRSKEFLQELIDKKEVIMHDIAGAKFYTHKDLKQKRRMR